MGLRHLTSTFSSELAGFRGDTIRIGKDERNDYINKALTIIDVHYSQFVNDLGTERRSKDMVTDFVELSMNLAGTAVGGSQTKTLLAAISAGVTGTDSALDKNFFYDMALSGLIAQMNADRTEMYRLILKGMQKETSGNDAYLWAHAVHDLVDYYNAGTLQHAAFSIKKEAGARQEVAEEDIKDLLFVSQRATIEDVADRKKLTNSLKNISAANLDKVKSILAPLANTLSHLPQCKELETKENSSEGEIKRALQLCIQDVSRTANRTFKEDHAAIAEKFRDVGILP